MEWSFLVLGLKERDGLPDALRVLVEEFPREGWETHPNFSGLVQFWLERHLMFRRLVDALGTDATAYLDEGMDPRAFAQRISRFGGMLVQGLHGHHQIEDHHYFPTLRGLDDRIAAGFDLLEADHADMDGLLARFSAAANGALGAFSNEAGMRDPTAAYQKELAGFAALLERHLTDEEDLIVPVILKTGGGGLA